MASVRELKSVWQLRLYDASRKPKRTTNSDRKSEYSTRAQAEKEADWREQLYERGEFALWPQDHPGDLQGDDAVTVGEAIERYVEDKTIAGEWGGWSENTADRYRPTLKNFAHKVGQGRLLSHLTAGNIRDFVYRSDLSNASKRTYYGMIAAWTSWLED